MQNSGFLCREIADVCLITAGSQRVARECAPDARLRDGVIQTSLPSAGLLRLRSQ
jgi:hypothetical protein